MRFVAPRYGYRVWRVQDGQLYSPLWGTEDMDPAFVAAHMDHTGIVWASCPWSDHTPPVSECSCGIHFFPHMSNTLWELDDCTRQQPGQFAVTYGKALGRVLPDGVAYVPGRHEAWRSAGYKALSVLSTGPVNTRVTVVQGDLTADNLEALCRNA